MDWLIDRQSSRSAEQSMSLLDAHLRRHAGSDLGVDAAVASVRAVVEIPVPSFVMVTCAPCTTAPV